MSLRRAQENLKISCPGCEQKLDASGIPAFTVISCPNCSTEFTVPFRFGQYLLEDAISEGRFAGIYRASDLRLKREVAIKVLFEELAGNAEIVELFLGAARRTAILNHINVLPIYSCDSFDGLPYIVMEHMEGHCLYSVMQSKREIPLADCVNYCILAAKGLDAAHLEGFDHNGLRPSNLLWDGNENIKISDFGMAEFKRKCGEALDLDWRTFFHTGYTAPEVLTGNTRGGCRAISSASGQPCTTC